ncbi:MAG TPA: PEP-CTERM sorting domain-containing protein [Burkholderiaceae bacterium]|nr:PEP-CTERM sorting domain-containing protein [Burkholderiaceae bacterium]
MKLLFLGLLLTAFGVHSAPISATYDGLNEAQLDAFAPFNDAMNFQATSSEGDHAKHQAIIGPFIVGDDSSDDWILRDVPSEGFYPQPNPEELRSDVLSVPEPATATLFALVLALLATTRKRR